jgi:hypothetical protein
MVEVDTAQAKTASSKSKIKLKDTTNTDVGNHNGTAGGEELGGQKDKDATCC